MVNFCEFDLNFRSIFVFFLEMNIGRDFGGNLLVTLRPGGRKV